MTLCYQPVATEVSKFKISCQLVQQVLNLDILSDYVGKIILTKEAPEQVNK